MRSQCRQAIDAHLAGKFYCAKSGAIKTYGDQAIYSYDTVIAVTPEGMPKEYIILNGTKYSITTTNYQSGLRYGLNVIGEVYGMRFGVTEDEILRAFLKENPAGLRGILA